MSFLPERSADGSLLLRAQYATPGWTYQLRVFEFETSVLNSLYNKDAAGSDIGDVTFKLYDSSDVEITVQATADAQCVKTVVDWEPTHDYEIVGGKILAKTTPGVDMRLYVIGVPDVPAGSGGSKAMVSGANLSYPNDKMVIADGRASKYMKYDDTYHTNKLRFILIHPAGAKCKMACMKDIFKA